jgi:hypothetical protein
VLHDVAVVAHAEQRLLLVLPLGVDLREAEVSEDLRLLVALQVCLQLGAVSQVVLYLGVRVRHDVVDSVLTAVFLCEQAQGSVVAHCEELAIGRELDFSDAGCLDEFVLEDSARVFVQLAEHVLILDQGVERAVLPGDDDVRAVGLIPDGARLVR